MRKKSELEQFYKKKIYSEEEQDNTESITILCNWLLGEYGKRHRFDYLSEIIKKTRGEIIRNKLS